MLEIKERKLTLEEINNKYPNSWVLLANIVSTELGGIEYADVVSIYDLNSYPTKDLIECSKKYKSAMMWKTADDGGVLFL